MASNSEFQNEQPVEDTDQTGAQPLETAAINPDGDVSGSGLLIEDLHEQMTALEEQIAAGRGDVQAAEVKLASLELDLANHLNGLEPGAGTGEIMNDVDSDLVANLMDETEGDEESEGGEEIANSENIAEELADIEPAAGEGPQAGTADAGGYGFQSEFDAQPVGPLEDIGAIDPTQLQYGVNFNNDKVFVDEEGEGSLEEDDNPIIIQPDEQNLDETNLNLTRDGKVEADFGNDGPGEICATGDFLATGSMTNDVLSSGGVRVVMSSTDNGYQGTANGQVVFTLTIDPATGDYNYTQVLPFDHADGSDPNDVISLNFGVKAIDADGDSVNSVLTINVADDAPLGVDPEVNNVDETDMSPVTSVSGKINADFGNDGAGSISGNGISDVGNITSNGQPVEVMYDPITNSYIGKAGGDIVFMLTVKNSGDYDFVLTGTLDHPDVNDPNDTLELQFGVTATDSDGDSVDGTVTINVADDAPVAYDDFNAFDAGQRHTDGNVISGENGGQNAADDLSQDQDNTVTKIAFSNTSLDVPETGTVSIDGEFGTLEISADGSYTYTLFDGVDVLGTSGGSSAFNPTEADTAGTQDSITKDGITISVANDGDYDISWLNTGTHGAGLGINNLNSNDSTKVWPKGETFKIDPAKDADSLTITIAELGDNNDDGNHGLDYTVTLADGSVVTGEVQFAPGEINNGLFEFTLGSADFGGQLINDISINSINDGQYQGASFLLNNVEATYPGTEVDIQDQFTYTLVDGDGDTSTATLTLDGLKPTLIVGENVDDKDGSTTPHHIGGEDGVIAGTAAGDILIGDVGGSGLEQQTQDYNYIMIMDASSSMHGSEFALLKAAVINLTNDLGAYEGGQIMVHFTTFDLNVKDVGTFDLSTADGLNDALTWLSNLETGRGTNYEAGVQNASDWLLNSGQAIEGAETVTYFISDGRPNHFINEDGNPESGSRSEVLDEITGVSDGTDETGALGNVIGVGIDISNADIENLDALSTNGSAINIDSAGDLGTVFAETNPINTLASVGDDVIEGGAGDDIIFGDSVNTDALADETGLNTADGAGWEVVDQLESGASPLRAAWDRADTVEYIRDNADELAEESTDTQGGIREGGDDNLSGGAGDDIIYGQEGDDVLYGGAGNDTLVGGSGADTFMLNVQDLGLDVVRDFSSEEGDVLDLSGLINNYDPAQQAIDNFIFARDVDGGTILSVDVSGSGDASQAVDLVALEGMQNMDLQAMVESGNIHVV